MSLTLPIPPELHQRLTMEAERLGIGAADCAVRLLERHLPPERNARGVALLESWIEDGDDQEQKET